jgi:hypothetical protein
MFTFGSCGGIQSQVPSLSHHYLTRLALDAVEEALAEAQFGPVPRTRAIRVVLAYLAWRATAPDELQWIFESFWRDLQSDDRTGRWECLNGSVNGLYRTVGVKREIERTSHIETKVRERRKALGLPHEPSAAGYGYHRELTKPPSGSRE